MPSIDDKALNYDQLATGPRFNFVTDCLHPQKKISAFSFCDWAFGASRTLLNNEIILQKKLITPEDFKRT